MSKTYYTVLDYKDGTDDDGYPTIDVDKVEKNVFAYKVEKDKKTKFYIKHDSSGALSMPHDEMLSNTRINKVLAKQEPEKFYKEVNNECFKHYLSYLKTKDKKFYKYATRTEL